LKTWSHYGPNKSLFWTRNNAAKHNGIPAPEKAGVGGSSPSLAIHVFKRLQGFKTSVSFQFVPIPGVSSFAYGVKLRLTNLRRAMLQWSGILLPVRGLTFHAAIT
jgi:hypothetical protein